MYKTQQEVNEDFLTCFFLIFFLVHILMTRSILSIVLSCMTYTDVLYARLSFQPFSFLFTYPSRNQVLWSFWNLILLTSAPPWVFTHCLHTEKPVVWWWPNKVPFLTCPDSNFFFKSCNVSVLWPPIRSFAGEGENWKYSRDSRNLPEASDVAPAAVWDWSSIVGSREGPRLSRGEQTIQCVIV